MEGAPAAEESDEELAKKRMSQWVKGGEEEGAEAADESGEGAEAAAEEVVEPHEVGSCRWLPVWLLRRLTGSDQGRTASHLRVALYGNASDKHSAGVFRPGMWVNITLHKFRLQSHSGAVLSLAINCSAA